MIVLYTDASFRPPSNVAWGVAVTEDDRILIVHSAPLACDSAPDGKASATWAEQQAVAMAITLAGGYPPPTLICTDCKSAVDAIQRQNGNFYAPGRELQWLAKRTKHAGHEAAHDAAVALTTRAMVRGRPQKSGGAKKRKVVAQKAAVNGAAS